MARAEAWELVSLVSPLVSQLLLSLVAAAPALGTGFACSGTPVLILWHPHAGVVVPLVSSIPGCIFPPLQRACTSMKGLALFPLQSCW